MKIFNGFTITVITVALLLYCTTTLEASKLKQQQRAPNDLDVRTPLTKIVTSLESMINSVNLVELIAAVMDLLTCFTSGLQLQAVSVKASDIHLPNEMQNLTLAEVLKQIDPFISAEDITEYCNSADFEAIHNQIWVNDKQLEDLVRFLWRFGYREIYDVIKGLYVAFNCKAELIPTLPNPPAAKSLQEVSQNKDRAFIREQVLQSLQSKAPAPLQASCDLITILINLISSGVLSIVQFIQTLLTEITTNPSLHFLLGKVQEPIKANSFKEFRQMIPVQDLMYKAHQAIISDPIIRPILDLVQQLLGLDLINTNIVELVVDFVAFLLYGNIGYVPPYVPSTTPPPGARFG